MYKVDIAIDINRSFKKDEIEDYIEKHMGGDTYSTNIRTCFKGKIPSRLLPKSL